MVSGSSPHSPAAPRTKGAAKSGEPAGTDPYPSGGDDSEGARKPSRMSAHERNDERADDDPVDALIGEKLHFSRGGGQTRSDFSTRAAKSRAAWIPSWVSRG